MSAWGWHPPHLVDNADTQYLGDHHWQQCSCFRFTVSFASICLSMCQSVCVSVHLFRINLKFFKTHNYWLAQLLYVSLFPGLELKTSRMHISRCLGIFPENHGRGISVRVWNKTTSFPTYILIVVVIIMSVALR